MQSCHSCTRHVIWSCSTFLPSTIEIFQRVFQLQSRREIYSNKTKGDNSKVRKPAVILVCDTLSDPVLHFYQVSSKYSKEYSSYRADKKFYANAEADANTNGICPKNNMTPPPFVGEDIIRKFTVNGHVFMAFHLVIHHHQQNCEQPSRSQEYMNNVELSTLPSSII